MMQVIEHIELASAQASITFSDIPQTYTDLYLVFSLRGSAADSARSLFLSINSSASNFTGRYLQGLGSGSGISGTLARYIGAIPAAGSTSLTFGNGAVYFPNYTASVNKSFSADTVSENNATLALQELNAGLWSQTTAISSLSIANDSGNLVQYSSATLYGILAGSDGTTTVS